MLMRGVRPAMFLLMAAVLLAAVGGCRDQQAQPRHNENLGTAEAPLLPGSGPVMDSTILSGGRAAPVNLPELAELPTLAERDSAEGTGGSGTPDAAGLEDQTDDSPGDEDPDRD